MIINLEENAWRQVLAILARASWQEANSLIMAIGEQMQRQAAGLAGQPQPLKQAGGNSGEPIEGVRQ